MMTEWSGRTSAYEHKHSGWEERDGKKTSSIQIRKIFEAQWSDCPVEVENQVKDYWRWAELGNDHYYTNVSINDLQETHDEKYECEKWVNPVDGKWTDESGNKIAGWLSSTLEVDLIIKWLRENGIEDDEDILMHWWW